MNEASSSSRENKHYTELPQFKLAETTLDNKNRLFEKGILASRDGRIESETILARLDKYNANTAQDFGLKEEIVDQVPLKLLREVFPQEQPSLSENDFENYIALSYCWHSDEWIPAEGLGDRLPEWPISPRMVRGLLDQRVSTGEGIWIDERCINQNNPSEKLIAIGAMDLIYKCARLVVVVIEDISFSKKEQIVLRRLVSKYEDNAGTPPKEDVEVLSQILISILEARWFKRAWCSHELQLGADFIFLFPTTDGIIQLTMDALDNLYYETTEYIEQRESLFDSKSSNFLSYEFLSRARDASTRGRNRRSFAIEFSDLSELQCSVETDIISICINIAGLQLYYMGGKKSRDQCRWLLAMIALCAGDATVLGGIEGCLVVDGEKESWMHWIDDAEDEMIQAGEGKLQDPPCIASIKPNEIILDLFFLADPSLEYTTPRHHHIILALFDVFAKILPGRDSRTVGGPGWRTGDQHQAEDWETRFSADLLACSLACGLEWMVKQMSGSALLAQRMQHSLKNKAEDLVWFFRSVLTMIELCEQDQTMNLTQEEITRLLQYFFFIMYHGVSTFDGSEDERFEFHECARIDLGKNEKALIPHALREYQFNQQYVLVVPVAASIPSCACVRRLWILERSGGPEEETWHIVDKRRSFTMIPIRENGEQVIRRNNQIIR